jgi:hypothetical protein
MTNLRAQVLILILPLISGFIGGFLSYSLLGGNDALAQRQESDAKIITAEKFVLVDSTGAMRAELGPFYLQPTLRFYESDGRLRTIVGLGPQDSPVLAFIDREGNFRAALGLTAEGEPKLSLEHKDFTIPSWLPWAPFAPRQTHR